MHDSTLALRSNLSQVQSWFHMIVMRSWKRAFQAYLGQLQKINDDTS